MSDLDIIPAAAITDAKWDEACEALPSAWFLHTSAWRSYRTARGDRDYSFAIGDGRQLVALVPLFQDERGAFLDGGEGLPAPAMMPEFCGKLEPLIGMEIYSLARQAYATLGRWRTAPLAEDPGLANIFQVATTRTWDSVMIDFTTPTLQRWGDVRASYRNLINRSRKAREITVTTTIIGAVDWLAFECYRGLHELAFGPLRSRVSFNLQRAWIAEGCAYLVVAESLAEVVASAYVLLYKGSAYYMSGPSIELNCQHAVLWTAVEQAAKIGARRFEVGWTGHALDEKGKGVEYFKTGFGSGRASVTEVTVEWSR